jgi:hypothetical protein
MDSADVMVTPEERASILLALTDIDLAKESGDGDKLNEAINRLNEATQTLAARLMDAAATKALRDKRMAEISASNLR